MAIDRLTRVATCTNPACRARIDRWVAGAGAGPLARLVRRSARVLAAEWVTVGVRGVGLVVCGAWAYGRVGA